MITLTTDFGTADPCVGIMKGVISSTDPAAVVVDITHEIAPQDLAGAAYAIYSAYPYFPPGSIHVVVVDPGVGSGRSIIAVSAAGHFFLAPDNGVLNFIFDSGTVDFITTVENEAYFLNPVSQTFHGRDIFAPVAGHLSKGLSMEMLGTEIKTDQAVRLQLPTACQAATGEIVGNVVRIDRFGNLITNIAHLFIQEIFGPENDRDLHISIGSHRISGLSGCYQDAPPGALLAIVGSSGFIEISVNSGNAMEFCGQSKGSIVSVTAAGR